MLFFSVFFHTFGAQNSMYMDIISSVHNARIKFLLSLQQKSSERRANGLFVVEGHRELIRCMNSGYAVDSIFICPSLMNGSESLPQAANDTRVIEVSTDVYEKIAYRGGTEGVIAIVRMKPRGLTELILPDSPLIVVVESVEKPGNLGAILRSADAAGVDAVLVCDPLTDIYNPNLIRSSLGAFFSVPCVSTTSEECIGFLKQRGIQILTAQLQDSDLYYNVDMKRATAIVMGTESTGLTDQWRRAADAHIRIPMLGIVDSLNVSVSAAILMYEAVRQRKG